MNNTRVNMVALDVACNILNDESFRSLIDWIITRGEKVELALLVTEILVRCRQTAERRASILSASASNLTVTQLNISLAHEDEMSIKSNTFWRNVFSLVSDETQVQVTGPSEGIHGWIMPHIRCLAELDSLHFECHMSDTVAAQNVLHEEVLSLRNVRRLHLFAGDERGLNSITDCLRRHDRAQGGTTIEIKSDQAIGSAMERIPPNQIVHLSLVRCNGTNREVESFVRSLRTSKCTIRTLAVIETSFFPDFSLLVSNLESWFHGGELYKFKLNAGRLTPWAVTRAFHSSDIQVLDLGVHQMSDEDRIALVRAISDVIPTMKRLKEFRIDYRKSTLSRPDVFVDVDNQEEHDRYVLTNPLYAAHDSLVRAVCVESTSISTCNIDPVSLWLLDRVAYEMKKRSIRVGKLLSTTDTPLSLFPLALSTLSEGHWYDVMAYIVRQKSDQLICDSWMDEKEPENKKQKTEVTI